MGVSSHEEVKGHLFTYVRGEDFEGEVLAGVTSYDSGSHFYSTKIDRDLSEIVERSRYARNLEGETDAYPVDQERLDEIALGVENEEIPLSDSQVKKMLGGMTDSEKARRRMDHYF